MQNNVTGTLQEFVDVAKEKGASDEFLCALLIRQGWPANDVYETLGQYWQRLTGVSIPTRGGRGESARDAFLYLLSFSTLAAWTTSLGEVIFDLINHWVADPVSAATAIYLRTALTQELAQLAVAFPIYLLVTALALREGRKHPDGLQSGVRKWLTYIALLGTAGTMICDLIWFMDYLLTGEVTLRFVLKSATVMVICAGIFAYYLSSLRWTRAASVAGAKFRNIAFGVASTVVVIAAFCVGMAVAGTPAQQRFLEADGTRINNLRAVGLGIHMWHDRALLSDKNAPLPNTLGQLVRSSDLNVDATIDPVTKTPFEYQVKGGNRYQVCADFTSVDVGNSIRMHSGFWHHGQGRTCFVLDASQQVPW